VKADRIAEIRARANTVDLPKLHAYGSMELTSPGVRRPLENRRVLDTVETLNAALDELTQRMADGRELLREVERLRAALLRTRYVACVSAGQCKDRRHADWCDAARAALEGE
jgi:hypothetical protein